MPRIINTFAQTSNPLADGIKKLGDSMFGDTLTPAINKQKLRDMQREELGTESMAKIFGGAADGKIDPNAAAEMGILGGMKPEDAAMWNVFLTGNKVGPRDALTTNAMAGAGKYENSAENLDLNRSNAFNMNAADNQTSILNNREGLRNAFSMNESDNATSRYNNKYTTEVQANTSIQNNVLDNNTTIRNYDAGLAQDTWKFTNTPEETLVNGQPGYAPRGALVNPAPGTNYAPISTKAERTPIEQFQGYLNAAKIAMPGATPEQQRSYALEQISKSKSKGVTVYDGEGNPIVQMGGDGPMELTNANQTKVQGDEMAFRRFEGTLGMADSMIKANPNSVGLVGQARGAAQDLGTMAQGAAQVFGIKDIEGEMAATQQEAAKFGINLNFEYDPSVSQIESVMNILAFQGARAIGGQSGNDLSDKDLKAIKEILGDPTSLFTNQKRMLGKLDLVKQYVAGQRAINLNIAGKAPPPPANTLPPAAAAPAPTGAGTTTKGTKWQVVQ